MVNYHLTVYGRVQGVGFRWCVYQLANTLCLTGFVRNQSDGSVYCEIQGEKAKVRQLINKIKSGPTPYAQVTVVQIKREKLGDYNNSFSIRR